MSTKDVRRFGARRAKLKAQFKESKAKWLRTAHMHLMLDEDKLDPFRLVRAMNHADRAVGAKFRSTLDVLMDFAGEDFRGSANKVMDSSVNDALAMTPRQLGKSYTLGAMYGMGTKVFAQKAKAEAYAAAVNAYSGTFGDGYGDDPK